MSVPTILENVSDLCSGVFLILMSSELLALDISSIVGCLLAGIFTPFIQNMFIDASPPLLIILCSQDNVKPIIHNVTNFQEGCILVLGLPYSATKKLPRHIAPFHVCENFKDIVGSMYSGYRQGILTVPIMRCAIELHFRNH